jgi:hypothetical protein
MIKKKVYVFFILSVFLISFASAIPFGYDYLEHPQAGVITGSNYSINVNNSQYLQGYTPTTLKNWIQGLFDSIYCKLTGCTMTGNLDTSGNITTSNHFIISNGTSTTSHWNMYEDGNGTLVWEKL